MRVRELPEEPTLPDSRLSHHCDNLASPSAHEIESLVKLSHLHRASDEFRQTASSEGLEPRSHGGGAHQLEDLERLGKPLHRRGTERLYLDKALSQSERRRSKSDCFRRGDLFHAGRDVRCLPDSAVIHMEITPDRTDDNVAGVQPNADADRYAFDAAHAITVPLDRLLHPQGSVARAHRVVLVGEGRAEEGHDPIAHHLVHGALVTMDGLHHSLEHRVENLARLLGVAVGQQLHRPLEVGEEDGYLLALALQGAFRGEDLLGEVPGGVGFGAGEAARWLGGERGAAGPAELLARRDRGATARAGCLEPGATVLAEARARVVLSLAPGTFHAGASKQSRR